MFFGETATFTVDVRDRNGNAITGVTIQLITDHLTGPVIPLSLISGTDLNGTWQGTVSMLDDTNCYRYRFVMTATSASGENVLTL